MKTLSPLGCLSLAALLATQASAESALIIEELVVTAQKRAQNLTDVPIAISSFGAGDIEATASRQLADLAEHIPNLAMDSSNALSSAVAIRGVGSNSRNIGFDGRVGVYIDGVYMGQSPALNQQLLDLERVEVLRGPQGALFGKNTVAGAINLITEKPGAENYTELGINAGNYGARQFSIKFNRALGEDAGLKFSAASLQRDGFARNEFDGQELGNIDSRTVRLQYRQDLSDSLSLLLSGDYMEVDQNSIFNDGIAVTDSFGTSQIVRAEDRRANVNFLPRDERQIGGLSMDVEYELGNGFNLRSVSAWRSTSAEFRNDVDYSPLDLLTSTFDDRYQQFTQEFQLISPASDDFNCIAGLYYYRQDAESERNAYPGSIPLFPGWPTAPVTTDGEVDTESVALFANAEARFAEHWRLGFGFRLATETKDVNWAIDGSGSGVFFIGVGQVQDSRRDTDFSPSLSLSYDFTEELSAYVRYAEGYKSGGYNLDYVTQADLAAGIEFDKETVENFELGLKGALFDGRARFSAALFRADYEDYQVNQFLDLGNGATSISIRNAAKVETSGAELELDVKLAESLTLSAAVGLLRAEFDRFPNGGGQGINLDGNRLPGAAERQASLALDYRTPLTFIDAELGINLNVNYSGDYFTTATNVRSATLGDGSTLAYGHVDSHSLVNLRISLMEAGAQWNLALWSKNLLDKEFVVNDGRDFLNTYNIGLNDPRTVGLEVNYAF